MKKAFVVIGFVLLWWFGDGLSQVFLTNERIEEIRTAVSEKREPQYAAFQAFERAMQSELGRQPSPPQKWYVPGYYDDAQGHRRAKNGLRDDANAAYGLALYYRLSGKTEYAAAAIRQIDAWAKVKSFSRKDDSMLSFSYHFPAMIFAADLLRGKEVWPAASQQRFEKFLHDFALPMNTMKRKNNWGNWGLVLAASCAAYLGDTELLHRCAERWKYFIEHQIDENGHLPHEVHRNEGRSGIWYSHFCLMPQTIAAEILKLNGHDLYDYIAPNGRSLQQAFPPIAHWSRYVKSFPYWDGAPEKLGGTQYFSYFELLNAHWPNEDATALLQENRPLTARHSAPFLTLTHGLGLKK